MRLDPGEWQLLARDVLRLAADLPEERTAILNDMRGTVERAVMDQYNNYEGRPGQLPPAFSGEWGTRLRVTVSPARGAIVVRNTSPYAAYVESGMPPTEVDWADLKEWAEQKIGVTNFRAIGNIWRSLARKGYEGMHVIERALSPSGDGTGPALHVELGDRLQLQIDYMMYKYGWGKG